MQLFLGILICWFVGLSIICYKLGMEIFEKFLRGFPTQRTHREAVIFSVMLSQLLLKIIQ